MTAHYPSSLAGHLKKQNPKCGWLYQKRYVVVHDCILKWFSCERDCAESEGRDARGFVNLAKSQCILKEEGNTAFTLGPAGGAWKDTSPDFRKFTGGDSRVLHFETRESEYSKGRWIETIRLHMNFSDQAKPGPMARSPYSYASSPGRTTYGCPTPLTSDELGASFGLGGTWVLGLSTQPDAEALPRQGRQVTFEDLQEPPAVTDAAPDDTDADSFVSCHSIQERDRMEI